MKKIVVVLIVLLIFLSVVLIIRKPRETITLTEEEYRTLKQEVLEEQKVLPKDQEIEAEGAPGVLLQKKEAKLPSALEKYLDIIAANMVPGGPPKDGIPAIDKPVYVSKETAEQFLDNDDVVYGIDYKGTVKAFPQKIMYWHEIVNDEIKGEKVSVTYCPLTGTTIRI